MEEDALSGKALTVLGPVDPADLGITLTHEHLLIDFSVVFMPPKDPAEEPLARARLAMDNLGWVRFNWTSNLDNLRIDDEAASIQEARHFRSAGGGTIVDATSIGIGRNPPALRRIAEAAGIHIIMGAGYYVEASHPDEFASMAVDDVAQRIIADIRHGVNGTGVRSGIIGEIGCSHPWTEAEKKSMAAAVAAQRETGAPLLIHPGRSERAPLEILKFIQRERGDLSRTIMGHIERTIFTPSILQETAATGAYLEFDLFGHDSPYYPLAPETHMPGDHERIDQIRGLIERGHLDRIVLAHDICTKHRLKTYGGHGFDHIIARVAPWMRARGIAQDQIETMLVANPARVLTFV